MKIALVDGNRIEAAEGLKGICPVCDSEVIAKCGKFVINHWAHKAIRNCDPWWENETEWHRSWKNNFSIEWQEKILFDETEEKHIADVRTIHDLVIEFQHSHIHPDERIKREKFYKHMVWVVDGTRLQRDYLRFLNGLLDTDMQGSKECFPAAWVGSSVPVIFDFKGTEIINDEKHILNRLCVLYPTSSGKEITLRWITRESFITKTKNGEVFKKQQEPKKQIAKPLVRNNITLWVRGRPNRRRLR